MCEAFGNCSGMQCQQFQDFSGFASFTVDKCQDPVAIQLHVFSTDDAGIDFQEEFVNSRTTVYNGLNVFVEMMRDFTTLNVSVRTVSSSDMSVCG